MRKWCLSVIPLAVPNLEGNERKYLNQCIDTTFVSSVGQFVTQIEKVAAEKSDAEYGVATSSGTTGLHLALIVIGVGRDDIVIIPSFTFIATANAVSHTGAVTWLMDIDPNSWTLDARQLESELANKAEYRDGVLIHRPSGKRIAAIMPVYTLGNVPDMDKISSVAEKYQIPVVADAAAAVGALYKGRGIGKLANLTVLSFNGNKTITTGGGGMVLGNDELLMKKLKHISTTARVTAEYDHDMVGYNYRMTNIQAAVGCAQFERLEKFLVRKRYIREYYHRKLSDIENISFFPIPDDQESACWYSGIILKDGNLNKVRNICAELKNFGIEARSFWKPVHLQKPYENAWQADSMKVTENLWDKIVTLPCSTNITDDELQTVCDSLRKILML